MNTIAQDKASISLPAQLGERGRRHGVWVAAAALLALLTVVTSQTINAIQLLAAGSLLFISIKAYLSWVDDRETKVPIWALLCAVHFVFYGLAIFGASRESPSWYDRGALLPDSSVTAAMLVGLLGLVSMWLGRKGALHLGYAANVRLPLMDSASSMPLRIQALLVLGILTNIFGLPFYGTSLWNISVTVLNTIPLAAFLWVILTSKNRKLAHIDFLLAAAFLLTRLFSGAKFGASLGTIAVPFLLIGLAGLTVKRRVPWRAVVIIIGLILFLQPSKEAIRKQARDTGDNSATALLKWVEVSASAWKEVFSGDASLGSRLEPSISRSSLLNMAGLIVDKTPSMVPYQHGAYYPLLIQNLIPRVLWANKPAVNTANQFFQVEYGLTDENHLSQVSIACGFEAEGYMNFGWLGIVGVGLFVGFIFAYYEHAFFSSDNTLAATAVGLALVPGFLAIESQLVQYLGGIVQIVVAAVIVFRGRTPTRADVTSSD